MITMPQCRTVDEVIEISDRLEGVELQTLAVHDTIYARTCHSDYQILLLDPESGQARVQGGRYFVEPVDATVSGSTFGGCMLKLGWLGIGLRIEIYANGRHILTSPLQSLQVSHPSVDAGSSRL
jgi:hypothetical protein